MASRVDKIYGDAYISVKTDEDALIEALEEAKAVIRESIKRWNER